MSDGHRMPPDGEVNGPVRVVAFGGGHGLSASLHALKRLRAELRLDLTAVVTVGDDGGSSGRLRRDRGGLPPGDLRQALTALADPADPVALLAADLWQHRFAGVDPLAGHALGNLLLTGLMELSGDPVNALEQAGSLLRAVGRVLPMSPVPVHIEATVRGDDQADPDGLTTVRGQHAVAVTPGEVLDLRLDPPAPPACAEVVAAVRHADWLVFGPGSWFTSVIPHLLVPELAAAIMAAPARRLVTLNLAVEQETTGLSLPDHLRALARYLPGLRVDVVLADSKAVGDPIGVQVAAESLDARVVLAPVAVADGSPRHDPGALAHALSDILASERPAFDAVGSAGGPPRPGGRRHATRASQRGTSEERTEGAEEWARDGSTRERPAFEPGSQRTASEPRDEDGRSTASARDQE